MPLGGVAVASSVLTALFFATTVLEYGITARVAQRFGAGAHRDAAAVAVQGLWAAAIAGVVLGVLVLLAGPSLCRVLGAEGEVLEAATTYVRISAAWMPFQLAVLVGNGHLRGVQRARATLLIAFGGNVVNLLLELWFVYGLDGGVAGSAWSTVLATALAGGAFVAAIGADVRRQRPALRPDAAVLRDLLRSGGHLSIRTGSLLGTLTLSTAVAARVSTSTLGGHQIALQVETFLALAVDALAIAAQALVGAALGAHDRAEARALGRRLLRIGAATGIALAAAVVASSGWLPHLFTDEPGVVDRASVALVAVGLLQVPAAVVFVLDGILLGASDDAFQGRSNVAAFVTFLPFAAAVLVWRDLGIAGVWAGLFAWMTARLVANAARFRGDGWMASRVSPS